MKLQLNESGLRNIKEIAKNYKEAWIYGHIDFDGVTSSLVMRYYLAQYGIKTTNWIPIQYGSQEYALEKKPDGVLGVLVDFSHGKIEFQIHTDHHQQQIQYPGQSKQFRHSKSNASTISSIISPTDIMSKDDLRIVDMVDSAGYAEEGISVKEIKNYVYNFKKDSSSKENQLKFGIVVNKLLLAYKNKPDYLKTIVMTAKPSLMSMYNVMVSMISKHIKAGDKGWSLPSQLQKNSEWYNQRQRENIVKIGSVKSIDELSKGKNAVIGNCIVQVGGGLMNKTGSYDRYTAFDIHPESRFFIMIWDTIGMMQVSTNNWNLKGLEDIDLGEIVLKQIFEGKYKPLLDKPKYDISLLAIKKAYEEKITPDMEGTSYGFNLNDFRALFEDDLIVSEKQQKWLDRCMKYKPSDITPNEKDTPKQLEYKFKCCKFLNSFKIPLSEIILKTSGGHKTITNLNGFAFLNEQQRITKALRAKQNPYKSVSKEEPNKTDVKQNNEKQQYESTSLKILKSIAKDVVDTLNKKTIKESVDANRKNNRKSLYSVGDTFKFLADGYTISGRRFIIDKVDIPSNPTSAIVYKVSTMDKDKIKFTFTQSSLSKCLLEKKVEKEEKEPIDSGEIYTESVLKENYYKNRIPEEAPAWGYDCVFTYHGYDFSVEAIVDNPDDKYYSVTVYKTDIVDDDDARLADISFDTWQEVIEYALNFDFSDDNPYKKSYEKSMSEPEDDGSELNENMLNEISASYSDIDSDVPPTLYDEKTYHCNPYTYTIEHTEDEETGEYYQLIAYKKADDDDEYELEEIDNVAFNTWNECLRYMRDMRTLYLRRMNNFRERTLTEPEDDGSELNETYDSSDNWMDKKIKPGEDKLYQFTDYDIEIKSDSERKYELTIFKKDSGNVLEWEEFSSWDELVIFIKKYCGEEEPEEDGSELNESEENSSWERYAPPVGSGVKFKIGLSTFEALCNRNDGFRSYYKLRIFDDNEKDYTEIIFDDWNHLVRNAKRYARYPEPEPEWDGDIDELNESANTELDKIEDVPPNGVKEVTHNGVEFCIVHPELNSSLGDFYTVIIKMDEEFENILKKNKLNSVEVCNTLDDVKKYIVTASNLINKLEPEWNGDIEDLNESDENLNIFKEKIIGKEITRNGDGEKCVIIKLPDDNDDPKYFQIQEKESGHIILVKEDELKEYFNFDINDYVKEFIKDPEEDGSELNENVSYDRRTLINRIKNLNNGWEFRFTIGGCNFIIQKGEDYDDANERNVTTYTLTAFDDDWDTYDYSEIFEDAEYLLDNMFNYVHNKSNEIEEPDEDGSELNETKASRFNKHLDDTEKSFATISAERSMPQIHTRSRQRYLNHKRTAVLEKLLKAWGLKGFIKTKGGFDEKGQPRVEINGDLSEEDSFFVPNITKEQAVRLGKLFNQDSVMFKEKGSNQVKELRTNIKGGDEGIGNETGLVFIVGQGRHNIGHDKTYYSRPKGSMIKFAFNPDDESN